MASQIIKCDIYAIVVIFGLMYIFNQLHYSRMIVLGTILGSVVLELFIFVGLFYAFKFRRENRYFAKALLVTHSEALEESQTASYFPEPDLQEIPVLREKKNETLVNRKKLAKLIGMRGKELVYNEFNYKEVTKNIMRAM
ncbi:MAG: hypothetical protein PHG41_00045 [Actinomycetota bacterium]|nr:hypothetical protein [Actinomycetota bacterium]